MNGTFGYTAVLLGLASMVVGAGAALTGLRTGRPVFVRMAGRYAYFGLAMAALLARGVRNGRAASSLGLGSYGAAGRTWLRSPRGDNQ